MKKELNKSYQRVTSLFDEYNTALKNYIEKALDFFNGVVEMTGFYKNYDEAEEHGINFDEQFPVNITLFDRHGFHHEIYVTKLYKKDNLYYIDGYDSTEGAWIEGWYTCDNDEIYHALAMFVDAVLNPEDDSTSEEEKDESSVLIGYQLVDEDGAFPSEFGCWDVFRTSEDAEKYRKELLDPEEYHIIEEWATPQQTKKYRFHGKVERIFTKGEIVWIDEVNGRTAKITKEQTIGEDDEKVLVLELGTGEEIIETWVQANNIYQRHPEKKCPKCGGPLYIEHLDEIDYPYYCPECQENCYEFES